MSKFVDTEETFSKYPIIQRQTYAAYLTRFLSQQALNGYVINLNSEWGAGKTTFLKCWYNELRQDHPVIYFDAWKSDFTHDAMTALIDCFHAQLANPIADNKELIKSFFEKGSHFVKKALPSLVVGYAKHKTGMDEDESLVEDITSTFGIDIAEKECGDALKDVLKDILEQRQKVQGIEEFKIALSKLASEYIEVSEQSESPVEYPIYVLIDELDRCRPNYAIEVIESVKHFFNTKNFVFVIATDSKQLQHSIKAVYGNGFDANLYLSRFFDSSVTLPSPELNKYLTVHFPTSVYSKYPIDENIINHDLVVSLVEKTFIYHGIKSLREVNKILLAISSYSYSTKKINILSFLTLTILKKFHPELYDLYRQEYQNPYRNKDSNHNTFKATEVSHKTTVSNLSLDGIPYSYKFEFFLHDCLSTILNGSSKDFHKLEKLDKLQYQDIHIPFQGIINHIVFNPDGDAASFDDYISLVDLSFIID